MLRAKKKSGRRPFREPGLISIGGGVKKILIIKPSSLGDVIHALPAVGAIRSRFGGARISWLVKPEWAGLLRDHPFIDEVIAVPFSWRKLPRLVGAVRKDSFDLVVDLQGLLRSALLGYVTRAPRRVGFAEGREGAPLFYTDKVFPSSSATHAVDRCRSLAAALGGSAEEVPFAIAPSRDTVSAVDRLLGGAGLSASPFGAIHPTARWESKKWPAGRFSKLADWLVQEKKLPVVFVGSDGEKEEINRILSMMKQPAVSLAGKSTLLELAEVLNRARFFVCNDSGPMHLAAAMKTPVFALFGPTDPEKVGPYGRGHTVIQKEIDCAGCGRNRCAQGNRCMEAISVEEVQEAIEMKWVPLINRERSSVSVGSPRRA